MPAPWVHRHIDASDLADRSAERLVNRLMALQQQGRVAQICLSGGRIAQQFHLRLAERLHDSGLDPTQLELWWGDERFLPTDHPERNAGPALTALASQFPLHSARTHPMPAADGLVDNAASAATYAKELGDTVFDVCLLGMGADGHVGSIFPNHPSSDPPNQTVIGVSDAPKPPAERISLTIPTINRSEEVWFLVSGEEKAQAVARALKGDDSLPAGRVQGQRETLWLIDRGAADQLPYFECSL